MPQLSPLPWVLSVCVGLLPLIILVSFGGYVSSLCGVLKGDEFSIKMDW